MQAMFSRLFYRIIFILLGKGDTRAWKSSIFAGFDYGLRSEVPLSVWKKFHTLIMGKMMPSHFLRFLAHLSQRLIGELIRYPWSGVRRPSTISNVFSSETTWPIKVKFHVEPPKERGNKSLYKWSRSHDKDGRHAHIL